LEAHQPVGVRDRLQRRFRNLWSMRFEHWLYEHSAMFYLLQDGFGWPPLGTLGGTLASIRILPGGEIPQLPQPASRPPELETELSAWYPTIEEGFLTMIDDLTATCADCLDRGIGYATFLIPPAHNVKMDHLDHWLSQAGDPSQYEIGKPRRLISEHLGLRNVPCFDLTPAILEAEQDESTYIELDGHFSVHGARAAAQALARFLIDQYWPIHNPDLLPGRGLLMRH
jgi:hypothetical protein